MNLKETLLKKYSEDEINKMIIKNVETSTQIENGNYKMNDKKYFINNNQKEALFEMQNVIHESCVAAGWYSDINTGEPIKRNFGEVIALMHSELSEALEGWRKNLMDDHLPERKMVEVELADTIIRILDTAGAEGFDLAGAIQEKFLYNQTREDHKIENRLKENGKKI